MNTISDSDLLLIARVLCAAENTDTAPYPFTVSANGPWADGAYDARVKYWTRVIVEFGIGFTAEEARSNLISRLVARLREASPSVADFTEFEIAERSRARAFEAA